LAGSAFEAVGDQLRASTCHHNLGNLLHREGNFQEAEVEYLGALGGFEVAQNASGTLSVCSAMGHLRRDQGRTRDAVMWLASALKLSKGMGQPRTVTEWQDLNDLRWHVNDQDFLAGAGTQLTVEETTELINWLNQSPPES
jgi:hypothetical protein